MVIRCPLGQVREVSNLMFEGVSRYLPNPSFRGWKSSLG